ncbi:DUF6527 family protein [Paludibacterium denitrificans]|uniref:DUF6527 family protein n=1 Tax=Paludibacterium denitrificans TaxID=2675226 RepID=UPI001E63176A|nr:DUF6527 family protein [Paludibacterium denitrificans]
MKTASIKPQFVEFIPSSLDQGVLYVSEKYKTATHLCACGCGTKIVTPLRPTEWTLIKRGNCVSLRPSIGNWNYPCQAHYWIRDNRVVWAGTMTREEIDTGRKIDRVRKDKYFGGKLTKPSVVVTSEPLGPKADDVGLAERLVGCAEALAQGARFLVGRFHQIPGEKPWRWISLLLILTRR